MSQTPPVVAAADALSLADDDAIVVDLCKPERYAEGHVPGAFNVDYNSLVRAAPPVGGLMPDAAALGALAAGIGLAPGRPVLAYDDEGGGRASRLLWTLYTLGHDELGLLDGGRDAWLGAGGLLSREPVALRAAAGAAPAEPVRGVADAGWILEHLGAPDVVFLDTRTPAEFDGSDRRSARGGHVPGAVNVDWTLSQDPARHRALRPAAELRALYEGAGVRRDAEVVVYCQTHHRSSHTFVVLRSLGYERVRGYPGAWSDWGNREDTPVEG